MKILMLSLMLVILSGCATSPFGTAASGGANYSYTKTPEGGCQVTINSARDIAGANLAIGNDCSVSVTAESAGGSDAIRVIGELVGKIK
jgi:uncharacterized protein YceK